MAGLSSLYFLRMSKWCHGALVSDNRYIDYGEMGLLFAFQRPKTTNFSQLGIVTLAAYIIADKRFLIHSLHSCGFTGDSRKNLSRSGTSTAREPV